MTMITSAHCKTKPGEIHLKHYFKTVNKPGNFTIKASRLQAFTCVLIAIKIPAEYKDELDSSVKPVVVIKLHSERCWKTDGDSLPCPDRP